MIQKTMFIVFLILQYIPISTYACNWNIEVKDNLSNKIFSFRPYSNNKIVNFSFPESYAKYFCVSQVMFHEKNTNSNKKLSIACGEIGGNTSYKTYGYIRKGNNQLDKKEIAILHVQERIMDDKVLDYHIAAKCK